MDDCFLESITKSCEDRQIHNRDINARIPASGQTISSYQMLVNCLRKLIVSVDDYDNHKDILRIVPHVLSEFFNARCCWINLFDGFDVTIIRDTFTTSPYESEKYNEYLSEQHRAIVNEEVFKKGKSFRVVMPDIDNDKTKDLASHASSLILISPIMTFNSVAGIVYLAYLANEADIHNHVMPMLDGISMIIANSIRAIRLQKLLESKLLKIASTSWLNNENTNFNPDSDDRLNRMARIIAKSLFKEMCKAGFGSKQIINTASEILAELSGHLQLIKDKH